MLVCFERARIDMQLRPYAAFGPERTSEDRSAVTG
jgi:hypothetical protein